MLVLTRLTGLSLDVGSVDMSAFPLGQFATRLRFLAVELPSGRGFFVLHGLDPKLYTSEQSALYSLESQAMMSIMPEI